MKQLGNFLCDLAVIAAYAASAIVCIWFLWFLLTYRATP